MRNILITGGAGFIGSNFIPYFLQANPDYYVVNLDKLTYAGDLANLSEVQGHNRYEFVQGDICDKELVERLFGRHRFEGVIHFAAESHVDNSIAGPAAFVKTNIEGTFVLLEVARKFWISKPFIPNLGFEGARFHHISTDEVYGSLGETGYFTESTPYAPNSPYSASKAASDFLVRSYHHTYGMNTVTTNCSNNYGPKQHDEKLIPTIIRKALAGENIPIYGDGKNIRDWLFVMDHVKAINLVFHKGRSGETYNIGSNNEKLNIDIAHTICSILDQVRPKLQSYSRQITFVQDRAGHDRRYAIDATKIKTELGWQPETDFNQGICETIDWYIRKYES